MSNPGSFYGQFGYYFFKIKLVSVIYRVPISIAYVDIDTKIMVNPVQRIDFSKQKQKKQLV
jgi:hypothetical protein